MIITKFFCDRCKKEVEKREDLFDIAVTANNSRYAFLVTAKQSGAQWCNPCLHDSGFFTIEPKAKTDPPPVQPTLEELITDTVQSIINNQ